jgi:hypothetical protein
MINFLMTFLIDSKNKLDIEPAVTNIGVVFTAFAPLTVWPRFTDGLASGVAGSKGR